MKYRSSSTLIMLSVLLLSQAFVSCASDTDTVQTSPVTETNSESIRPETEPIPAEYSVPEVDYNGESFTIAAIDYYTTNAATTWKAGTYCEVFSFEENGDPLNDAIYQRNRAVAEELNVTLDLYSLTSFDTCVAEFRKIVMAAEDVIDVGLLHAERLYGLLGTGALVDLHSLPNVDFSHSWWDQKSVDELTILDKMYAVTGDISLYINYSPIVYYFNKQLVNTLSLDDPYTLVDNGTWTMEKMMKMASDTASDLNGDGTMSETADRYGLLCEGQSLVYTAHASGVSLTDKDNDGLPLLNVDIERAASMCEQMVPFMNDENIALLNGVTTTGTYKNGFFELFLPMFCENRALFFTNQLLVAMDLRNMNDDFGIVPPPKFDEAQKNYLCPINDWWGTFLVMPVTNTKYDMTGHVIEAMGYYGQQLVKPAFVETTVRGKAIRDDESSEMINLIFNNRVYELASFYNWGNVNRMFASMATKNKTNYASEYTAIEKKTQAALADTVELLKNEE